MKIIDAHLHLFRPSENSAAMTRAVGHGNTPEDMLQVYKEHNICAGIVMGNQHLSPEAYQFPEPFRYCIGVGSRYQRPGEEAEALIQAEEHLKRSSCAGIKIYAGYTLAYVSDPRFEPYYQLAEKYDKPVAIHTGMTAGAGGQLKYAHPLTVDEVACTHPRVQFVLCHFGNPFLPEAAAVMEKNSNVAADLSGLLSGIVDLDWYFTRHAPYVERTRMWLHYLNDDSRFMFGTDFPAVNVPNYIAFISRLVDEESREKIFFDNANRIYSLGL